MFNEDNKTICAVSSPSGVGAIAIIRLSGLKSVEIAAKILNKPKKILTSDAGQMVFTTIVSENKKILDEVLMVKFLEPHSFTGENAVEIYCHGSEYIQSQIISELIAKGASVAQPGEFSKRAFLNGKMDLSQSEAVADLIASSTKEGHRLALNQMKGQISNEISDLRKKMLELVSLMELELDFGEEDVEFADRTQLSNITEELIQRTNNLIDSFKYGNAIKTGIPVAIIGEPNVGKSTLLNALLKDDRAIVSDIPGTTRDSVEETLIIDGIKFRLIDTAGIRNSEDSIEKMGVERTYKNIKKAQVILLMIDANSDDKQILSFINKIKKTITNEQYLLILINKNDIAKKEFFANLTEYAPVLKISAKTGENLDNLSKLMSSWVNSLKLSETNLILTNSRHLELFAKSNDALIRAKDAMNADLSGDFISQDLREAMYYLGEITGHISNNEILASIFSKFCIGK
ncbi:MAG: tRNA uridine-5-carboxymethylaminomethyl(34) synthesis GTPase MnmE [Bacteroidales bacterium]|nr:tRNA uridine-5-carboxymethylaminomethyl(34) synthesis GTPase MnmE [Bacteroidales bacterium]MDY0142684.1 tRNA uridine-5-carboxymethylaminomethyl(34) synthesis GTPase MnmE [Bacteroidales bacterium]